MATRMVKNITEISIEHLDLFRYSFSKF